MVGKAWGQSDPEAGLRYAANLRAESRPHFIEAVMGQWAEKDLAKAIAFASSQDSAENRPALARGLVSVWAKSDPVAALAWSEQHLEGFARTEVIAASVKSAAEKDIAKTAELVAGMEPGKAQSRACSEIFEIWFKKGADVRDEAFGWLAGLEEETRNSALDRVAWQWVREEPDAVRDFIAGPHGDLASPSLIHRVAEVLSSKDPETAMDWASKLPADRLDSARSAVLENWLALRPEGAAKWARSLPESATKAKAIHAVSQALAEQPGPQAVEWYRSLGSEWQKVARDAFLEADLPAEKRKELESAIGRQ
jgi:hypothetical protein